MSEPVKIIVTAETAQAAADLARFVSQAGSGLKSLAPQAAESGEALQKMRESSMLLREGMHGIELGAMSLAGTKLPGLAEAVMGLRLAINGTRTGAMLFGVGLSEMLLPIAGIAAALGAGYLLWEGYGNHMEDAETKAKNLAAALEKLPEILKQISAAQAGGLVAADQAKKWQDMLSGATPLYRNSGSLGGEDLTTDRNIRNSRTGGIIGQRDEASQDEKQKFVEHQILLAGLNKTQSDAAQQLKEIHDQDAAESLAGVQKKIALENDRFQKELEHIRELHDITVASGGKDNSDAAQAALDRHNRAVDDINEKAALERLTAEKKAQAELDKLAVEWQKQIETFMKKNVEDEKRNTEEKKHQTAELEKQVRLQGEIARANIEAQLASVQGNPFLTRQEKQDQSIPLMQQMAFENAQRIAALQTLHNQTTDPTAQLEAEKQITQLKVQQADLANKISAAQHPWKDTVTELKSQAEITMTSLANTFKSVFDSAINSISHGITGLITGTQTWAQALRNIYNSILNEIVSAIVTMGVRWVMTQIMMAVAGKAIMASAVAASAPLAAAQSAIWALPATLSTTATAGATAAAAPGEISIAAALTAGLSAFAAGGRPQPGQLALVGERGPELFVPDSAGTILTASHTASLMSNHGSPVSASPTAGSAGRTEVHNFIYHDKEKMMDDIAKSDAFEKNVVDVMSRNIHKYR